MGQICSAQIKVDYNIYLLLNSDSKQMNVVVKKISDTVQIKTFSFSKAISAENFKYNLSIDKNGKIIKGLKKPATNKKDGKIRLHHYSYIHSAVSINDLSDYNVINYDDFMDAEFKSFSKILRKADKIYIIDMKENKEDSGGYKAYEVTF